MNKETRRYWLTFSTERAKHPVIWEMSRKFDIIFNIRNASVTDQVGVIALELSGEQRILEDAIKWFRRKGVQVDPIELAVVES